MCALVLVETRHEKIPKGRPQEVLVVGGFLIVLAIRGRKSGDTIRMALSCFVTPSISHNGPSKDCRTPGAARTLPM